MDAVPATAVHVLPVSLRPCRSAERAACRRIGFGILASSLGHGPAAAITDALWTARRCAPVCLRRVGPGRDRDDHRRVRIRRGPGFTGGREQARRGSMRLLPVRPDHVGGRIAELRPAPRRCGRSSRRRSPRCWSVPATRSTPEISWSRSSPPERTTPQSVEGLRLDLVARALRLLRGRRPFAGQRRGQVVGRGRRRRLDDCSVPGLC